MHSCACTCAFGAQLLDVIDASRVHNDHTLLAGSIHICESVGVLAQHAVRCDAHTQLQALPPDLVAPALLATLENADVRSYQMCSNFAK